MATKNNQKLATILVFLCLLTQNSFSQTLHAVVFADTGDSKIGESVAKDYIYMQSETNRIASAIQMPIEEHFYLGDDFRKEKLLAVINSLQVNAQDVVLVYVTSHGARAINETCAYPQISFPPYSDQSHFSLCQIDQIIKAKNPRFYLIMGDLCNSESHTLTPKKLEQGKGNTVINAKWEEVYRNLYAKSRGSVMVTSSQAGETSVPFQEGGAFTLCFAHNLDLFLAAGAGDWHTLLKNAKLCSQEAVQRTPTYEIRLQAANTVTQTPPPTTNTNTANTDNTPAVTTHTGDRFISDLLSLADNNRGEEARISGVPTVAQRYFAGGARVEVIGRNGTTVVATENAEKFLRRLSTSFKLVNIVELENQKNGSGKITSLKVHEIYRQ